MNAKVLNALFIVFELSLGWSVAWSAQSQPPYPKNVTFTTRATTPFAIEGLTMDATGNFYHREATGHYQKVSCLENRTQRFKGLSRIYTELSGL